MEQKDLITRFEESGWLNINKPINCTSTRVVAIIKRITKAKKVGHGGTLDPLASGVLPICINKATKQVESMMDHKKQYLFHLTFGESRSTCDEEGDIVETSDYIPTETEIKEKIKLFIGQIEQTPPVYSAIKINGKRACDLTREGKEVELKPRIITIDNIQFNGFINKNTIELIVDCGRGCYIRSLGVDLARALGIAGYISKLVRTRVGDFDITTSLNIENLTIDDIQKNLITLSY